MSGLLASLVLIGCAIGFIALLTAITGLAIDGLYRFQEGT
jgi:hypothetical protein